MQFQYTPERIFAEDASGKIIAEITFPINNGIANIDHTFVDDSLRGQGVAAELVAAAAAQLRKNGIKCKVTCSYAITWFAAHPEQADILATM